MPQGYELIITEKPRVSERIAHALGAGKVKTQTYKKIKYYEFEHNGDKIVVAPAVGHVFTLKEKPGSHGYPIFNIEWIPSYEASSHAKHTKAYIDTLKHLIKNATSFTNACDYDIEGSLIGYNVLKFIFGEDAVKQAKRMKFSALTEEELKKSYKDKEEHIDFNMVDAGITRHILDWYWGINTSRALSYSYKAVSGRYLTLSAGRVQTPTLKILDEREKEIKKFVPEPFWNILSVLLSDGFEFQAEHEKGDIFDKEEANRIYKACKDKKQAKVQDIKKKKFEQHAPSPFNLMDLQTESYKLFKYTPKRTQIIAQGLYEEGLISYPRTSSQKLPKGINPKDIIKKLSGIEKYKTLTKKLLGKVMLKAKEGKKTDPAHPCIYPTGDLPKKLNPYEEKLYDLIVKRFFSTFGKPAIRESQTIYLKINEENFHAKGTITLEKNWHEFYDPYIRLKETELPELKKDQTVKIEKLDLEDKETQPPKRYSPASILRKMDDIGLGTKATRANILQTLYDRNYISGIQIAVTDFGSVIVDTLEEFVPELTSEGLTKKFEEEMERIKEGKLNKEAVIDGAKETLTKLADKFKVNEGKIGEVLVKSYAESEKKRKTLGKCPKCGSDLIIRVSRSSGKQFVGCSGYPKCHCSYPLPQSALIVNTGKNCEHDGLPIVEVRRSGKRRFKMCIDAKCKSKADWGKKKAKKEKK